MGCDKEYVCESCSGSFDENEIIRCHSCNAAICPGEDCGGEIITMEEWLEHKQIDQEEEKDLF